MSRVERVAAHAGQIDALLQRIINECDAAQTEVLDYLNMRDVANKQNEKLKAENAELRKLLRQVVEHVHEEHLPHEDISFWSDRDNGVFRRMRELGIEVSEWA